MIVQALSEVSDETRPFYLVGPGQQPMQYCSSFEGYLSLIKLFFYYLVARPGLNVVINPGLNVVINP